MYPFNVKMGSDDGSSDDPVAHGIVKDFWLVNSLHRWRTCILYDDLHVEDFGKDEMMEFGFYRKSGSMAVFPHTKLSTTESRNHANSNPWVTVKPKRKITKSLPADRAVVLDEIVHSQQLATCLCGCSSAVVLTLANESFRDLCQRIPGVLNNRSQCYEYLQQHHNYGHNRSPRPGFTFHVSHFIFHSIFWLTSHLQSLAIALLQHRSRLLLQPIN
jgi:hypothetical protein